MLSVGDFSKPFGRREFLRIGGLGLGGLSLADLLRANGQAAGGNQLATGRSVVFLFMHGGPSQIETFETSQGPHTQNEEGHRQGGKHGG